LEAPGEADPVDRGRGVGAVAGGGAFGCGEDAAAFVEAHGVDADLGEVGGLSDLH
jgi:hypothetical protein